MGNFSPKTEGTKTKSARCLFFLRLFPSCTYWILCDLLLLFTFYQVCLLVKETAEIETRMAEKPSWDQANIRQNLGLVWRNRKKNSQIIKDYFYLPFFLLIILCSKQKGNVNTHSIPVLRIRILCISMFLGLLDPGSGSVSHRYGSSFGFVHHHSSSKNSKKNLLFCDFFLTFYLRKMM